MPKSPNFRALFEFDPEIEQTFHRLKRQKAFKGTHSHLQRRAEKMHKERLLEAMSHRELIAKLQALLGHT